MLGKNPLLVDRKVYAFKGKWQSPNSEDLVANIYYFISNRPTLTTNFQNGREQLVQEVEITCYGEHAFCVGDYVILQTGETKRIEGVANNYFESNIAIRDMMKQRIESQVLILR